MSDTYAIPQADLRALAWQLARITAQLSAAVDVLERQLARADRLELEAMKAEKADV